MAHACVNLSEIELYFPQVCARACVHLYVANASAAMSMLFGRQRVMSMLSGSQRSLKHLKWQLFFSGAGRRAICFKALAFSCIRCRLRALSTDDYRVRFV